MTPQHESLSAFLDMGGYGFFVWWSYAIVAATLVINVVLPWWRNRQTARQLRQKLRRAELARSEPVQPPREPDSTAGTIGARKS